MPFIYEKAQNIDQLYFAIVQLQLHSYSYEIIDTKENKMPEKPVIKLKTQKKQPELISTKQIKKKIEANKFFSGFILSINEQIYVSLETRSLVHLNKGINCVNIKFPVNYNGKSEIITLDLNYCELIEKISIIKESYILINLTQLIKNQMIETNDHILIYYLSQNQNEILQNTKINNGQMITIYHSTLINNQFEYPIIRISNLLYNQSPIFDTIKSEKEKALMGAPIFEVSNQYFNLIGMINQTDDHINYIKLPYITI